MMHLRCELGLYHNIYLQICVAGGLHRHNMDTWYDVAVVDLVRLLCVRTMTARAGMLGLTAKPSQRPASVV